MIGRLRGRILEKKPPQLIIDVMGVGYEVFAPMSTFYNLPELNQEVILLTHMVVREDAQLLYGFAEERERSLFRALIKVNGVGPKLALTILSGIEPDIFVACVRDNDTNSLISIPGIGKKTAERLVIETRDQLAAWQASEDVTMLTGGNQHLQDAISALVSLGYKQNDAKRAIDKVAGQGNSSEDMIRLALQTMVTRS